VGACIAFVVLTSGASAFAAPLSEKAWRKQANAICRQTDKDVQAATEEVLSGLDPGQAPTPEQNAAAVRQLIPLFEESIASIDALREPRTLRRDVRQLRLAVTRSLAVLSADPTSTDDTLFVDADRISRKLGLTACT
jgi:hypothetical protein